MEKQKENNKQAALNHQSLPMWFSRSFLVAGIRYENRQESIEKMNNLTPIYLLRESSNEYDKNAVAVYEGESNQKIGYLPKHLATDGRVLLNSLVANYLDAGGELHAGIVDVSETKNFQGVKEFKKIFQVSIVLSKDVDELNDSIEYQRYLRSEEAILAAEKKLRAIQSEIKSQSKNKNITQSMDYSSNRYEDDWKSDHDDYNEDGIPYEDIRDNDYQ